MQERRTTTIAFFMGHPPYLKLTKASSLYSFLRHRWNAFSGHLSFLYDIAAFYDSILKVGKREAPYHAIFFSM